MKNLLSYVFLFIGLSGCNSNSNWNLESYVQKIEDSPKVLYRYDAWGGRDTQISGYILQDSTKAFKVNNRRNLPFTYLETVPTKDRIDAVDFEKPDLADKTERNYLPIKTMSKKEGSTLIATKLYSYQGFMKRNGGLYKYEFDEFTETRDCLIFYNVKSIPADIKSFETSGILAFKKTNVEIFNNGKPHIVRIVINDLKVNESDNEIISNKTYYLIPKNEMAASEFSNFGIFKQIQ